MTRWRRKTLRWWTPDMSLIKRLESATEGSRELDWAIHFTLHPRMDANVPIGPADPLWAIVPRYTSSIDAALTLVPEGYMVHLNIRHGKDGGAGAFVGTDWDTNKPWFKGFDNEDIEHEQPPALALCIAALKARDVE